MRSAEKGRVEGEGRGEDRAPRKNLHRIDYRRGGGEKAISRRQCRGGSAEAE